LRRFPFGTTLIVTSINKEEGKLPFSDDLCSVGLLLPFIVVSICRDDPIKNCNRSIDPIKRKKERSQTNKQNDRRKRSTASKILFKLIRSLAKTNTLLSLLLQKNDRRKQTIN
jgi:hypothetical protein